MGQLQTLLKQKEGVAGNGKAAPADQRAEAPQPEAGAARLVTGLVCRDVARSLAAGTPLIYDVLVGELADRLPHPQRLVAVSFWLFDGPAIGGTHRLSTSLLTPDRELLSVCDLVLERPGPYQMATFDFGTPALPAYGQYRVEVHREGQFVGSYPFFLLPKPAEQNQEVEQ